MTHQFNQEAAEKFEQMADLLEQQHANPFRVGAYRRAALTLSRFDGDVRRIAQEQGAAGLVALPTVGKGIAAAIMEMAETGRWSQLERMRGELEPVVLFQTIPGIGPALAKTIHDELHVDTLESLEAAAHDGRLGAVAGLGSRRVALIRAALASMLGARMPRRQHAVDGPAVGVLLDVDREYRDRAASGALPTIAPKRFNPEGEAWLPILHTLRDAWHFTVLFSNTARAHELGRTRDWVVVYFYDDSDHEEGQCTVVTETHGSLTGLRVVRGREAECRRYYRESPERLSRQA